MVLMMNVSHGKESRTLHDVLLVPDLAYNLISVTAAAKRGKVTTFSEIRCEIRDSKSKLVATGHREGSLYYLDLTTKLRALTVLVPRKPFGIVALAI